MKWILRFDVFRFFCAGKDHAVADDEVEKDMKNTPVKISDKKSVWPDIFLVFLGAALVLRLVIWKFLPTAEVFFREEFSNVAVAAVILLMAVVWAMRKVIRCEPMKKSGLELPVFLLVGAGACSLLYTADFPSSVMGMLVLGAEVAFFYMLVDALDTPKRMRWALFFFLVMAFIVSAYGIKEFIYLWNRPVSRDDASLIQTNNSLYYILVNRRVVSFLGWPNSLSGYLLLILPLVFVLPFRLKSLWQKIVVVMTWPVFLACFLFTFSFLGWTSFVLATLVLLPIFWEKLKIHLWPKERKILLFVAVFCFCVLFLWVIFRKNFLISLSPRLSYYRELFALWVEKPFLGHGWGTFGIVSRQFSPDKEGLSTYAHNTYLQVWVEAGIVGFLGVVLLVVNFFRRARASVTSIGGDKNALVFMAIVWGMTAFLIDNVFSFTMLKPNIALYGWTMLAVFCVFARRPEMPAIPRSWFLTRVSAGAAFLASAFMLFVLIRLIGGYAYYYEARQGKRANVYNDVARLFTQAEAWDSWSSYLPAGAGDLRVRAYMATNQVSFLKEAEAQYLEAIRYSPYVYANYFILGRIYATLGNQRQANAFNAKAAELSPVEFGRDMDAMRMREERLRKKDRDADVPVQK